MSDNNAPPPLKRRHIRFEPVPGLAADIDMTIDGKDFQCQHCSLVVEYSPMGGCGLVMLISTGIVQNSVMRVKIGSLPPLKAQVIWCKQLDDKIQRCGIKFLE